MGAERGAVPGNGLSQPLLHTMAGRIAEALTRLGDIRLGIPDIARTKRAKLGFGMFDIRLGESYLVSDHVKEVQERGPFPDGDVVDRMGFLTVFVGGSQKVGLQDVIDVAKVSARLAVTVHDTGLPMQEIGHPYGNHGGIRPVWTLPFAKNIEIPQSYAAHSISLAEDFGIQFIDTFGDGVG